jgi:diguanylate cyclase (GGDEF)-like protein
MLSSHLDIETLAEEALREFAAHAGVSGGLVAYETQGELKVAASYGVRDPASIIAGGGVEATMRRGERRTIVIPPEVRLDGVLADFRPGEVRVCPVAHKGVPLGAIVLATTERLDANQGTLIDLFLQGFGLALNNAIAHDRLQHLAALDPLTGVYNRRFGLGRLREEFGRAVRVSAPLGVLMLDIDHFKAVNDTYGHLAGDRVLKSVCACVRSCLREGDVLMRYGGEELLAVMPAASSDDLWQMGERLRRAVRASAPLGVLMLDIDHFKAINDTYGHLIGDRVLKTVCANVRSCLREGDVLMRYGGEELLAVMPAASSDDLWQMGERLRRCVEDACIEDGSRTIRVTLSAGGAAYPSDGVERDEDLIRLADEGLYKAKEGGRNRVEIAL